VEAANILFIGETEEPAMGDPGVLDHLDMLGHTVTYRIGLETTGEDVAPYDLLIMSSTNLTANIRPNGFDEIPQPILTWESSMVRSMEGEFWMTDGQQSGQFGTFVKIVDASHPIFEGLNLTNDQELEIFTEDQNFFGLTGEHAPGANLIAVGALPCCEDDRLMIIEIPKGGELLGESNLPGNVSPGARVFIPLSDTSFDFLNEAGLKIFDNALEFALGTEPPARGDFNGDGNLDAADIDVLTAQVIAGNHPPQFDLGNDGKVDEADRRTWIKEIRKTWYGDANLDGEFSSADFVAVFVIGEYEDALVKNSTWSDGDWNGDQEFNSSDFVVAFSDGGFELGPVPAHAVPEPANMALIGFSVMLVRSWFRRPDRRDSAMARGPGIAHK
jgi:hypothetical protein